MPADAAIGVTPAGAIAICCCRGEMMEICVPPLGRRRSASISTSWLALWTNEHSGQNVVIRQSSMKLPGMPARFRMRPRVDPQHTPWKG
jgi:hypothetical protein